MSESDVLPDCPCIHCIDSRPWPPFSLPVKPSRRMMVLCEFCGNKRCPHASYHGYECTGSNDSGQPGSVYGPEKDEADAKRRKERAENCDQRKRDERALDVGTREEVGNRDKLGLTQANSPH